ncbi:hypothetical protein BJ742DRAFT_831958 [Cladochytrium replicatum]|nr:hypothetical protein BJ742DRAFT_831958 [Cladochytrium replicatum]
MFPRIPPRTVVLVLATFLLVYVVVSLQYIESANKIFNDLYDTSARLSRFSGSNFCEDGVTVTSARTITAADEDGELTRGHITGWEEVYAKMLRMAADKAAAAAEKNDGHGHMGGHKFGDFFEEEDFYDPTGVVRLPAEGLIMGAEAVAMHTNEKGDAHTHPIPLLQRVWWETILVQTRPPIFMTTENSQRLKSYIESESSVLAVMYQVIKDAVVLDKDDPCMAIISNAGRFEGLHTAVAAVRGARFIYTFEPIPDQQRMIWMTTRMNGVEGRVHIIPKLLEYHHIPKGTSQKLEIDTVRLDNITSPFGKKPFAFWNIPGGEGTELRELDAAKGWLQKKMIKNIVISSFGPPAKWDVATGQSLDDMLELLHQMDSYGYDFHILEGTPGFEVIARSSSVGSEFAVDGLGTHFVSVLAQDFPYLQRDVERAGELRVWFTLRDTPSYNSLMSGRGHAHKR